MIQEMSFWLQLMRFLFFIDQFVLCSSSGLLNYTPECCSKGNVMVITVTSTCQDTGHQLHEHSLLHCNSRQHTGQEIKEIYITLHWFFLSETGAESQSTRLYRHHVTFYGQTDFWVISVSSFCKCIYPQKQ